ncbi:MAG: amidohydrolase family protein [Balneolaceae bacterium]
MKSLLSIITLLLLCCGSIQGQDTVINPLQPGIFTIDDRAIVFKNVNLIPMDRNEVVRNQTVIIEGDRISKTGPDHEVSIPAGATVIQADGKYLIPGLAEMHGHVPSLASSPERYLEDVLFLYLAGGVTTVRGMLGHPGQLRLKEQIEKSILPGPNLYLAGPSFSGNSVDSPEEASERVFQQSEEGWDLLKVHPGLTLEEYRAMAESARTVGIPFAGHVPADVGLEEALRLGQQTIDHLDGYIGYMDAFDEPVTEEELNEVVELTLQYDAWVVPTMALWETIIGAADHNDIAGYEELRFIPREIREEWMGYLHNQAASPGYDPESNQIHAENRLKLLKALSDGGVPILLGTDAPQLFSVPGLSMQREIPLMERAGLTPFEILESGTKNVGDYFSNRDDFGIIAEGYRADLLLLPENPLNDLSVLQNHDGVMVRGIWFPREVIDEKLAEIEQAYR